MIRLVVQRTRTTLDLLLWRQHGVSGQSLIEHALAANPGVADLGVELPLGTVLFLPEMAAPAPAQATRVISLFGED